MEDKPGSLNRERKQSSGDLHSRLKTRKLLGVGETDDGDVHRSKLSQILGHSDKLYLRLPGGTKEWQLLMAVVFFCAGVSAVFQPGLLFESANHCASQLASRLYGGYLISLSCGLWLSWRSADRAIIQFSLVGATLNSCIQLIVIAVDLMVREVSPAAKFSWPLLLWLTAQLALSLVGASLLHAMGCGNRRWGGRPPANQSQAEAYAQGPAAEVEVT